MRGREVVDICFFSLHCESHPKASAARIHAMAGTGHRHHSVVLRASPGASLPTARRGASSWIGAGRPWQLTHLIEFGRDQKGTIAIISLPAVPSHASAVRIGAGRRGGL
jgi:hypothetical protein